MSYVIETRSLTKKYGGKTAVKDVCVHIGRGEIYGLIGKNGAGKTTLMKLILGLVNKNSGDIKLFDEENLDAGRRKIGSLIEAPAIYKNETAFENMKRFSYLAPTTDDEIKRILDLVGIGDTGSKKAGAFSLGMKQRLGLAIALLGSPEVLILDEPINGLDPAGIKEIRDIIVELNGKGVTFMISSHILDELGKIATTYGIMSDGALEEITADELKEACRSSLKIVVDDGIKATPVLEREFPTLFYEISGNTITVKKQGEDAAAINRALVNAGINVYELKSEGMEFEDYFIERLGK